MLLLLVDLKLEDSPLADFPVAKLEMDKKLQERH
jgi:hypothetical protein